MSEDDIVKDFLFESYENLDRLDRDLVGLEKNPQDGDALAGVFRTIHTIKHLRLFRFQQARKGGARRREPLDALARPSADP